MIRYILAVLLLATPSFAQRPALNSPVIKFTDINGKPLAGGKLYTYAASTLTPQSTYVDATTSALNTNPVILDSTGSARVFLGTAPYKFILKNSADVTQWTADNITQSGGGSGTSGVAAINGATGYFTFAGPGVSCVDTLCTFAGGGTAGVTTVSGVNTNGFTVSVANPTTTPAITVGVDGTHVLPVKTGSASTYLDGTGNYSTPAGGGGGGTGNVSIGTPFTDSAFVPVSVGAGSNNITQSDLRVQPGGGKTYIFSESHIPLDLTNLSNGVSTYNMNFSNTAPLNMSVLTANNLPGSGTVAARVNSSGVIERGVPCTDYQPPVSLTTTGSGAATFNCTTGLLNIPTNLASAAFLLTPTSDQNVVMASGQRMSMSGGNPAMSGSGLNELFTFNSTFNAYTGDIGLQSGYLNSNVENCSATYPGWNNGNSNALASGWMNTTCDKITVSKYNAGIANGVSVSLFAYGNGDSHPAQFDTDNHGGCGTLSDECATGIQINNNDTGGATGTIVTGGSKATTLTVSIPNTIGTGRLMIDKQTATVTNVTYDASATNTLGNGLSVFNTSITMPVSTRGHLYGGVPATSTSYSITSNLLTVQAPNTFLRGMRVLLYGWPVATYLNNQAVSIDSATSTSYTINFSHANVSSTSEVGYARTLDVQTPRSTANPPTTTAMTFGISLPSAYSMPTPAPLVMWSGPGGIDQARLVSVGTYDATNQVQYITLNLYRPINEGADICIGGMAGSAMKDLTGLELYNSVVCSTASTLQVGVTKNGVVGYIGPTALGTVSASIYPSSKVEMVTPGNPGTYVVSDNNMVSTAGDSISAPNGIARGAVGINFKTNTFNPYAEYHGTNFFYSGAPITGGRGLTFHETHFATATGFSPNVFHAYNRYGSFFSSDDAPESCLRDGANCANALLDVGCFTGVTCLSSTPYFIQHDGNGSGRDGYFSFQRSNQQYKFYGSVGYDVSLYVNGNNLTNAITNTTGDVTMSAPTGLGSSTATLAASGVTAGTYTCMDGTVDAKGRLTSVNSGTCSGGGGGVSSIDGQTGAFTFTGSGVSHVGNAYTFSGSGGSSAFSALTSGTNTTAAMVVGSGASLAATGTGTIDATTLLTKTWASPGAIGTTTPASGAFTSITGSSFGNAFSTAAGISTVTLAAATSSVNQPSPIFEINGAIWNGTASQTDVWRIQSVVGTGTNPTTTLNLNHASGTPGAAKVQVPNLIVSSMTGSTQCAQFDTLGNLSGTGSACGSGGGGGTVTSVTSANSDASVATTTTTPVITINNAPTVTSIAGRLANGTGISFSGAGTSASPYAPNVGTTQNINTLSNLTTAGYVKTTSGGVLSSGAIATADVPAAGSTTQIQFNNAGAFGADSNFAWDTTNGRLLLNGAATGTGGAITLGSNTSTTNTGKGSINFDGGTGNAIIFRSAANNLSVQGGLSVIGQLGVSGTMALNSAATGTGSINISGNIATSNTFVLTPQTVAAGATPALLGTKGLYTVTLASNAAPTVTGIAAGQRQTFVICQPASGGPYTWTWPAAYHGGMTIGTTASTCSIQAFVSVSGTTFLAESVGVTGVAP